MANNYQEANAAANDAVQRAIIQYFKGDDPQSLTRTIGWLHIAEAALEALRALPVDQRMEAMGMERWLIDWPYQIDVSTLGFGLWKESDD